MTAYAVPDPAAIQDKAQADLNELLNILQKLTQKGQEVHVQVSWPTGRPDCVIHHSVNFPAGVSLQLTSHEETNTAAVDYWQAKDNSFRAGYDRGYTDGQENRPYNSQPS